MLSLGTEFFLAFWIASNSVGLPSGSPPPVRAATSMFLISFAKSLPRLASSAAFLCFVVAHFEWPLTTNPPPFLRTVCVPACPPSARGGTPWPTRDPGEPRRSYRRRLHHPGPAVLLGCARAPRPPATPT